MRNNESIKQPRRNKKNTRNDATNKPYCGNCLSVFKNRKELNQHQEKCLLMTENAGSFLKHFPRRPDDPMVVVEKLVIPPSQPNVSDANIVDLPSEQTVNSENTEIQLDTVINNHAIPAPNAEEILQFLDEQQDVANTENNNQEVEEDPNCPVCREEVEHNQPGIRCDSCQMWFHKSCLHMPEDTYEELEASDEEWFCVLCKSIKANKIKWGLIEGEENIRKCISGAYEEIITWKKNIFMVPRGKAGTEFINEKARLLKWFTENTKWYRVALALFHLFGPLMLQKPSSKSKARDNAIYLQKRLQMWKEGKIIELLEEGREIQARLTKKIQRKADSKEKTMIRLMLLGKVGPAMKHVNNEDQTLGVHPFSETIKDLLEQKHPHSREASEDILITGDTVDPLPVIFEEIDANKVYRAALHLQGSGGPTLIDAEGRGRLYEVKNRVYLQIFVAALILDVF